MLRDPIAVEQTPTVLPKLIETDHTVLMLAGKVKVKT